MNFTKANGKVTCDKCGKWEWLRDTVKFLEEHECKPNSDVVIVRIEHDQDATDPMEYEGVTKLVSFSSRHRYFEKPIDYQQFDNATNRRVWDDETKRRFANKTAFILSYFEHGSCCWSLQGTGPQCQWDNVQTAGLLFIPEDVAEESRVKYAKGILETYTDWCNGNCYGYTFENDIGDQLDSCWGFYGDDIYRAVAEALGDREYKLRGDINDGYARSKIDEIREKRAATA